MSTIFLDRDGIINENREDYVKSWSEFRFLPGSREAIARLTQAGHRIVVCTNQVGVARGTITVEAVHASTTLASIPAKATCSAPSSILCHYPS